MVILNKYDLSFLTPFYSFVEKDLFTVFSTFYVDQLEKIRRYHWNERLKISKIAKFESDTSLANED